MRIIRYLSALGLVAGLAIATPASAVTTVKIIAANGTWIGWTSYYNRSLYLEAYGPGWACVGGGNGPGQFWGGAANASCVSQGTGTVHFSGGEWWIDYPEGAARPGVEGDPKGPPSRQRPS